MENNDKVYKFSVETNKGKLTYFVNVDERALQEEKNEFVNKRLENIEKRIKESGLHLSEKDKNLIIENEKKRAGELFITKKRDYYDKQAKIQAERPEMYNFKNEQKELANRYLNANLKQKQNAIKEFTKYQQKTFVKAIKKTFEKTVKAFVKVKDFIKELTAKSKERTNNYSHDFKVAGKVDLYDKVQNQKQLHDEMKNSILLGKTKSGYEYTM